MSNIGMTLDSYEQAVGEYVRKCRDEGALIVTLYFRIRIPDTMKGVDELERRLEGLEGHRIHITNAEKDIRLVVKD